LREWYSGELKDFIGDIFISQSARTRPFLRSDNVLQNFTKEAPFSRKTWGLLNLELWHQIFHDRAADWREKADIPASSQTRPLANAAEVSS
jgi:asparagine synthase (glutamine-hydrolysing)